MLKHSIIAKTIINPNSNPYTLVLAENERDFIICYDYHEDGTWEQGTYFPKFSCVLDAVLDAYMETVDVKTHEIL